MVQIKKISVSKFYKLSEVSQKAAMDAKFFGFSDVFVFLQYVFIHL